MYSICHLVCRQQHLFILPHTLLSHSLVQPSPALPKDTPLYSPTGAIVNDAFSLARSFVDHCLEHFRFQIHCTLLAATAATTSTTTAATATNSICNCLAHISFPYCSLTFCFTHSHRHTICKYIHTKLAYDFIMSNNNNMKMRAKQTCQVYCCICSCYCCYCCCCCFYCFFFCMYVTCNAGSLKPPKLHLLRAHLLYTHSLTRNTHTHRA